ncbi:hypothetical protein JYU15_02160, partial [bacterium AH-315-I18]|nr:hypothetical protein [bacterium AH-315-I18]
MTHTQLWTSTALALFLLSITLNANAQADVSTLSRLGKVVSVTAPMHIADPNAWGDTFYQYRMPLTVQSDSPGWQQLPIDAARITDAINALESFKYDPLYFSFNDLRIVALDKDGNVINDNVQAGMYLALDSKEMASSPKQHKNGYAQYSVIPNKFHILQYTASGESVCPLVKYEAIHPAGTRLRKYNYKISFFPPRLPLSLTQHQRLFIPDRSELLLKTSGRFAANISDLSVRKANIAFCANFKSAGTHRLVIYYQPMGSHHLQIPEKRIDAIPLTVATL